MAKSFNSPTARLLQNSRLFSLPSPLPQPSIETTGQSGTYRASDSATLPYPTHQAITTPASSHFRGDFGVKRPLPSKATRTSTPHIKIRGQDTFAHITDFSSAADHTQTVAKWRQMGLPMVVKDKRSTYSGTQISGYQASQSVYDENLDHTDPEALAPSGQQVGGMDATSARANGYASSAQSLDRKRWKYAGPWITGMQPGEFNKFVSSTIEARKQEFRGFLITRLAETRFQNELRVQRERGESVGLSEHRREELRSDVEENFEHEEKRLRDEHAAQSLSSELTAAICDFLDLPGIRTAGPRISAKTTSLQNQVSRYQDTDEVQSPPTTHPGAGLSHLRSNAFLENHPLWGAQAHHSPVLARVLRPRSTANGSEAQAKLGVGGVVTQDPATSGITDRTRRTYVPGDDLQEIYLDTDRMAHQMDPDLPGGNKFWVQPDSARVDERGQIRLHISRGDKEAIAVKTNQVEAIHDARNVATQGFDDYSSRITPDRANYGYSLSDTRLTAPTSRPKSFVRGFDEELGRARQQRQTGPKAGPMDEIQELMQEHKKTINRR